MYSQALKLTIREPPKGLPKEFNLNLYPKKEMVKTIAHILLVFILFTLSASAQINTELLQGTWEGKLEVQGTTLRIRFHLQAQEGGGWQAKMDSPDQFQYDIAMDTVVFYEEGDIELLLTAAKAFFRGRLAALEQGYIEGHWNQGGAKLSLKLEKNKDFRPRVLPQTPQPPFPYRSEEVTYRNNKADIQLGATITLPADTGRVPAILLITGSGAQDRDETIAGHKPFWVIADHFSRRGYAVLRVDDRGVGQSGGNTANSTSADFVTDVRASIAYLKQHPDIDPKRIVLMGHSEGGLIAFMTAAVARRDVAAVVSLAGPGLPMSELLLQQISDIAQQQGMGEKYLEIGKKFNETLFDFIIKDKKDKMKANDLLEKIRPHFDALSAEERDSLELNEASLLQSIAQLFNPWFRYFIKIDPTPYIKKTSCPILALNGSKDIQVAAAPNLEAICRIARQARHRDVTCTEIPDLNHLFQTCNSCTIQEYGELEETFSPAVLKAIDTWLYSRLIKK